MGEPARRRVRWTEHGPVPIEDEPADETVVPVTSPPPVPARAVAKPRVRWTEHGPVPIEDEPERPDDTAVGATVEISSAAEGDLDPPEAAPRGQVGTRRAARAEARARRRIVDEAPPPENASKPAAPEAGDDPDAVRARLAARGVLRTSPSVRIRDVTDSAPRTGTVPPPPEAGDDDETPRPIEALIADSEALGPEPPGPTVEVSCLSCRARQDVSSAATGYRCRTCTRVWRWATCDSCEHLDVTLARQESWRCRSCGATSRSWWRTPEAPRHAETIAARRQVAAAEERRTRALDAVRRQRTSIVAGVVVVAVLIAFVLVAGRVGRSADVAVDATSKATCAAFDDLAADLAGSVPPAALRARLDELAASAADADEGVRIAAERLAASGRPGDHAFETARGELTRQCRSLTTN